MNVVEVLKKAREKIADPRHWTQGRYARDHDGQTVPVGDPNAVCWCASGAIRAVVRFDDVPSRYTERWDHPWSGPPSVENVVLGLLHQQMGTLVPHFNDTHTHQEVLGAFDAAIQFAESQA